MRVLTALAALACLLTSCGGVVDGACGDGGARLPKGSSADVHPLTSDAGFFLSAVFTEADGNQRVRVTAALPTFPQACHPLDGGGYFGYPDGGFDFTYPDAGSADGDGGCHITSSFLRAIDGPLQAAGMTLGGAEEPLGDGGAVEVFIFDDWRNVDGAVRIAGAALVDAELGGPIDFRASTAVVRCL